MGSIAKIGIPRGLFYWQDRILWETFFSLLGIELVVSSKTNLKLVTEGVKISENESCFAYKVFMGHVLELVGQVDAIFIPTYLSSVKNYVSCPKFCGITHVLRSLDIGNSVFISPTIDLNKKTLRDSLLGIASLLGKDSKLAARSADGALSAVSRHEKENLNAYRKLMKSSKKKIVVFSHHYIQDDEYINFRIFNTLEKFGLTPVPIWLVPIKTVDMNFSWDFAVEEVSKLKNLDIKKISGLIQLSSFACGPDSIITEYLYDFCKARRLPFLSFLLDEHTGEAGFMTRLEAFFDTISFFRLPEDKNRGSVEDRRIGAAGNTDKKGKGKPAYSLPAK